MAIASNHNLVLRLVGQSTVVSVVPARARELLLEVHCASYSTSSSHDHVVLVMVVGQLEAAGQPLRRHVLLCRHMR